MSKNQTENGVSSPKNFNPSKSIAAGITSEALEKIKYKVGKTKWLIILKDIEQ